MAKRVNLKRAKAKSSVVKAKRGIAKKNKPVGKTKRESIKAINRQKDKKYDQVVDGAKLEDIRLVKSECEFNPEYFAIQDREKKEGKALLRPKFNVKVPIAEFISDQGIVVGQFEWSAITSFGNKHLFKVKASYFVIYGGLKKADKEMALFFLKRVGKFAVFPYFRALVSDFSSSSGADLPILPVLKD